MNTEKLSLPEIYPVACHTDHVGQGSTFVAIRGMKDDGIQFVPRAIERGAQRIVVADGVPVPSELVDTMNAQGLELIRVPEPRRALAELAAQAHDFPAQSLKIVATTGTKGKSTTTFLIEHLLRSAGKRTALLSTVKNTILGQPFPTKLTTQQPDYLQTFFALCRDAGVEWVAMEVAAQAFSLYRVHGLVFEAGVFTNFSREHGEFYPDQEDYFAAKCCLLRQLKPGAPLLLNADDVRVAALAAQYGGAELFSRAHPYSCPQLVGSFNAYNIAAAAGVVRALGLRDEEIGAGLATFAGVPGRLDRYALKNGAVAFIDYAHNQASMEAVLSQLRGMTDDLTVVFGAGGDRDPVKRPEMGRVAAQIGDAVFVTADNPRSEDPAAIAQQIVAGIPDQTRGKVVVELDRERAIVAACQRSRRGSIIALLGKGPDEYQIVKGVTIPFSERAILQRF
ncbi:MAG: UDP-N-acetylmuramoyl-L-alanyl-D-glutamate--2,6-diaminopimelate ligase [Candidatus Dependentiae bacterium]|nr:UDP-N-acetylmuramoyl-L-alanyl-D-glutamate--2,6-diaminopimelate ligase [Candidatus Dependentiae bacterium]